MQSENPPPQFQSLHPVLLPEEIIEEVLSRLPVKSLLRFRCVSISWLCLIGSKRFVKTHLQNIAQNTSFSHHKVIFSLNGILKQYSLNSLILNNSAPNPTTTNHPCSNAAVEIDDRVVVVGCCNGLVCIAREEGRRLLIWNPSTRISNELPRHDHHVTEIDIGGFGWDESSGTYKVLVLLHSDDDDDDAEKKLLKVYSSKTNAWKTLEHMHELDAGFQQVGCVSGRLHWFNMYGEIIAFDLKSEVIETIKEPYNSSGGLGLCLTAALGALGGCFSVGYVYEKGIDVWVMKRYGVQEPWLKVMTVSCLAREHVRFAKPLCIGANGEILLYFGSSFAVYNPRGGVLSPIEGIEASRKLYLYIESLVSPFYQN